jgi:hypothetical protein
LLGAITTGAKFAIADWNSRSFVLGHQWRTKLGKTSPFNKRPSKWELEEFAGALEKLVTPLRTELGCKILTVMRQIHGSGTSLIVEVWHGARASCGIEMWGCDADRTVKTSCHGPPAKDRAEVMEEDSG